MFNFPDTIAPGRVDIIIFPNGGKEVIGRQPSYPPLPEIAYLNKIRDFVATKQGLEKPEKFTGFYSSKENAVSMTWTAWAGEIPQEETVEEPDEEGQAE